MNKPDATIYLLHLIISVQTSGGSLTSPKGVLCNSIVPRVTNGKYVFHSNHTYELQLSTHLDLPLDLHHRSCFQIDIASKDNGEAEINPGPKTPHNNDSTSSREHESDDSESDDTSSKTDHVKSVFYVINYEGYEEDYAITNSFRFGIPELRSHCKCDCPKSDSFCHEKFGAKFCTRDEVCVQRFHANQPSYGCQHDGPAKLCCEISVRPYQNWRFRAVKLGQPIPTAVLKVDIYVKYDEEWSLFRQHTQRMPPSGRNLVKINGAENVAHLNIRAHASRAKFQLSHDTYYYYLENAPEFRLRESPVKTSPSAVQGYGFLLFRNGRWNVPNAPVVLAKAHSPRITHCQEQKYIDGYDQVAAAQVIRNSSGSINFTPKLGKAVEDKQAPYIDKLTITNSGGTRSRGGNVILKHAADSAPNINLDIHLKQNLNIVAHLHLSHLAGFVAKICRDKHLNRFLNITLINAYGEFGVDIFRGRPVPENLDLTLTAVTKLPLSSNYSEIRPLPGHVTTERVVCVYPAQKPKKRNCKLSEYVEEPVVWYTLPNTFIESKGNCPGCNLYKKKSFFAYLNPRTWFDGIGTMSEGVALGVEIAFYVLIALILLALFRRVIWPIIRWACCPAPEPRYLKAKEECSV